MPGKLLSVAHVIITAPGRKLAILLFTLLLLTCATTNAQHKKIDSLYASLAKESDDSNKVNTLMKLSSALFKIKKYDSAFKYMDTAENISVRVHFENGCIKAYTRIASMDITLGKYDDALINYTLLLEFATAAKNVNGIYHGTNGQANVYYSQGNYPASMQCYYANLHLGDSLKSEAFIEEADNGIGTVCYRQGNYSEALNRYLICLKILEKKDDKPGIADISNNIGDIYTELKNYDEALNYYNVELKTGIEIKDTSDMSYAYDGIADAYCREGKTDSALKEDSLLFKTAGRIKDLMLISYAYRLFGDAYFKKGMNDEALNNYNKALELKNKMGEQQGIAEILGDIGKIYINLEKYNEADDCFYKALKLSQSMGDKKNIKELYNDLSHLDTLQGNWKSSLENYIKYGAYKDSLYNEESIQKIVNTKMTYQFDKQQAIDKLEQDKKNLRHMFITIGLAGILAVSFIFGGVFFRQRNRIKTEKKHSDDLLLNILPPEVADELKLTGKATAKHFDDVTILFTDFKGFTTIGEKLSPTLLVDEINHCFIAYDKIMQKYGIEKIKTIGDAYMAVCGLPHPDPNHAEKVVSACSDIISFMNEYKEERLKEDRPFFEVRIGINSGSVVAGIVGIKKFAYDIWGDTVNTAARMEQNSEPGKINISGSTYELVKDKFNCVYRGKIHAKNKGEIDMYFVS